ncbi:hypothetical protein MSSAC_2494 [Methanosarcina siciliae C2J]|uniref:Uncharacterized protein n=1 Tax=Methanosarcina siciliae C2J TaxID=1434118 RepID=A0A0E3PR27_9EURY|nr:hypothetical protein [Methanosarcina siciliae]AKB37084.1 hypothetical protein MSSAC_2494 [Methanosarcina siciliae C2J]
MSAHWNVKSEEDKIIITLAGGFEYDLLEEWAYVDKSSMDIVPVALNTLMDEIETESLKILRKNQLNGDI